MSTRNIVTSETYVHNSKEVHIIGSKLGVDGRLEELTIKYVDTGERVYINPHDLTHHTGENCFNPW